MSGLKGSGRPAAGLLMLVERGQLGPPEAAEDRGQDLSYWPVLVIR
jgi:hypothetical protein